MGGGRDPENNPHMKDRVEYFQAVPVGLIVTAGGGNEFTLAGTPWDR